MSTSTQKLFSHSAGSLWGFTSKNSSRHFHKSYRKSVSTKLRLINPDMPALTRVSARIIMNDVILICTLKRGYFEYVILLLVSTFCQVLVCKRRRRGWMKTEKETLQNKFDRCYRSCRTGRRSIENIFHREASVQRVSLVHDSDTWWYEKRDVEIFKA